MNILDATKIDLTSAEIEQGIEDIDKIVEARGPVIDDLLTEVRQIQLVLNITPDYKYHILLCGIFNPKRSIIKNWAAYEKAFLNLVGKDGENGPKRLFQAIILFFINKYPQQKKYASSLCKILYDNNTYSDEFFKSWHANELKLDKNCILYDRKAEKQFRPLLDDFIQWLDYGEEEADDYGEEEAQEETPKEAPQETDAQKNQRLLIEQQQKAQQEKMAASKLANEQQKEMEKAQEEEKNQEQAGEVKTQNITKIEVEDGFDIDGI